jgi:hypothetical protein
MAKTESRTQDTENRIERRYKLIFISDRVILQMIKGLFGYECLHLPDVSECLPDDSQIMSVHFDYSMASFAFVVYSSKFDVVPDGAMIPTLKVNVDYKFRTIKLPKDEEKS